MAIAYFCDHCGAEIAPEDTICPLCQQPLASSATFQASGTLLNERYSLISEVGAGGFGAVYKARDTQGQDRLVAVKQINLQGLSSQEIIEATDAFNREAEILTTLNHPLLPTIFDRFSDPEHWYLVMTYIDGTTLDEYLQQHRVSGSAISAGLPLGETLEIALRLCDALHYLHSQQPPVIFRDLKPGNIMRTRKGQLYLIDFGIARRFKPGQAKDTIPFGSPGFAAPEQYGRAQTTPQADIYSLGALLYCLITGDDPSEHPFSFPSLHHYAITGTRELNALIQRMVSPDPISRPASIQVVQAEFRRIQDINTKANQQGRIWTPPQGQTPPANGSGQQHIFLNPTLAKQQQARKTTRRAVITTALVLGGVAAFGGIAALANQSRGPVIDAPPPPSNYQVTPDVQNPQPTPTATSSIQTILQNGPASWSPDLNYAAVINANQIELYKVQEQQFIRNITLPNNLTSSIGFFVWWSPDNSTILVQVDSGKMYSWNVASGQQLFTFEGPYSSYNSLNFSVLTTVTYSPDEQIWAVSYNDDNDNTGFALLQINDGKKLFQKFLSASTNGTPSNVAWSPDNRYFAFPDASAWVGGQSWSVGIWDRTTYQRVNSFGASLPPDAYFAPQQIFAIAWSPGGQKLATAIHGSIYITQLGDDFPTSILPSVLVAAYVEKLIWSPNERYLAVLREQELSVYDASEGGQVSLNGNNYSPQYGISAFVWSTDSQSITVVDSHANISHCSVG